MSLNAGTRLGPYEITALLGAGGMGEVYRARDPRLGRDVAIKILPDAFAHDAERVARFEREAQALAALNHPSIASIHGVEDSGPSAGSVQAVRAIVMELVEGPTLADRVSHGPVPLEEALPIARQISEALEAAHDKGITHRDLKPANIKVSADGHVKVLDFGLAKVRDVEGVGAGLSQSPTIMAASMPGTILGTAAYMSPEQAKGKQVDRTADVWAFGCVLYEMLAGRAVFEGETISEVVSEVLKSEPDWTRLPADTPEGIRRLLRRCLQKDRKQRLHDMADARIEIDEAQRADLMDATKASGDAAISGRHGHARSRRREQFAWLTAVLATLVAIAASAWMWRPVPSAPEMRVEITTPPTSDPASLAISPDGQKLVFVANSDGRSRLWLRALDAVVARPLAGTDSAQYPFWSPDSQSVGFFADRKLKRIDLDGGSVQALANAGQGRGGAWNRDGTILFAPQTNGPLFRVSATGGEPIAVTRLAPQQGYHRFPQFLPDGHHFLYYVFSGRPETGGIYVGQLEGSETRHLLDADTAAVFTSSGHLLYVRQGTLFAQRFDPIRLALAGNPVSVAEQVAVDAASTNLSAVSAAVSGPIVYRTGAGFGQRQFVWFDRSSKEIAKLGDPDSANTSNPDLSPDGRRVVLQRTVNLNTDIWQLETARGVLTRVTSDPAIDLYPLWSPDGSRVVFSSNRNGAYDLFWKPFSGASAEDPLLSTAQAKNATDWSRDGRFLLYRNVDPKTGYDLWVLPMDGDKKAFPVVQTAFEERDGQFSPDGKWIAYQSNESGRFEIYVQPFPGSGNRSTISTSGGAQVRWRHDGKELFYIALDGRLMAVPVRPVSNGLALEPDAPVPLFQTRIGGAVQGQLRQMYMVSADGRILMNTLLEEAASPITLILNWKPRP